MGRAASSAPLTLAARDSLAVYLGLVHRTHDGRRAVPPRHLRELVIPVLEDDSLGHTLIVAPPGSGKTTVLLAAVGWWIGRDPSEHIAILCSTDRLAYQRSVAVRQVVTESPEYRAIFPAVRPDRARGWAEYAWYVERDVPGDKDPTVLAAGVGASILGVRLSRIVLDDVATEDNQATALQRAKVRDWLARTVLTRLTPDGRAVMICTRWHAEDPAAWAQEQGWHTVVLPALDEEGRSYWPEVWPSHRLRCPGDHTGPQCCKARELGSAAFAQQYLGLVVPTEGAVFDPAWWRRYRGDPPPEAQQGGLYVDTAGWTERVAPGADPDYAALAVWLTDGVRHYLAHAERGRWDYPALERRVLALAADWSVPVVVEDTPWARPLIQRLRAVHGATIAFPVEGRSKLNRARAVAPLVEAGDCWIPEEAPWLEAWLREHAEFPHGAHDDWVDTTTMHLLRMGARARRRPVVGVSRRVTGWATMRA